VPHSAGGALHAAARGRVVQSRDGAELRAPAVPDVPRRAQPLLPSGLQCQIVDLPLLPPAQSVPAPLRLDLRAERPRRALAAMLHGGVRAPARARQRPHHAPRLPLRRRHLHYRGGARVPEGVPDAGDLTRAGECSGRVDHVRRPCPGARIRVLGVRVPQGVRLPRLQGAHQGAGPRSAGVAVGARRGFPTRRAWSSVRWRRPRSGIATHFLPMPRSPSSSYVNHSLLYVCRTM
jgi:hypothetical protein